METPVDNKTVVLEHLMNKFAPVAEAGAEWKGVFNEEEMLTFCNMSLAISRYIWTCLFWVSRKHFRQAVG
jgi:hypothetical protein